MMRRARCLRVGRRLALALIARERGWDRRELVQLTGSGQRYMHNFVLFWVSGVDGMVSGASSSRVLVLRTSGRVITIW